MPIRTTTRTKTYQFTVTSLDDSRLVELREKRRLDNIRLRQIVHTDGPFYTWIEEYKIRTRGRLGPKNPNRFNKRYRRVDYRGHLVTTYQDCARDHATRFDVYYELSRRFIKNNAA